MMSPPTRTLPALAVSVALAFVLVCLLARAAAAQDMSAQESAVCGVACDAEHASLTAGHRPAKPVSPAPNRPPHVVAASVCWLEASFSHDDCAALLHVLLRRAARADVDLPTMAWRYTALRRDHARARLARQLGDHDEPTWTAAINRQWAALRELARGVLDGTVPDPCVGASHWGGMRLHSDQRRARAAVAAGRWVEARCAGATANTFFREVRR